jgi:regulator of protease activity HflC (stomatin/prohibitin superfamily)
MGYVIGAVVIVIVGGILVAKYGMKRVTILEFEKGLKYHKGKFKRVLGPGQYWYLKYHTKVDKVDVRPRFVSITGQEVLSSDSVTLKVSLAAKYEIADPNIAVNSIDSYANALYMELQLALRQIIGSAQIDDLLAKRDEFSGRLMELTEDKAEQLGLKLHSVNIKDIMLPGQLKQMFAQVVNARKQGLAALERARGETAALRNLANAAKMVNDNPALMQLRLVQAVGDSSGNTLVLGLPAQSTPLPIKTRDDQIAGKKQIQANEADAQATE